VIQITLVVKNVKMNGKIMNNEDEEFMRIDKMQNNNLMKSLGFPDHRSPKKQWVNLTNDEIQTVADEVQFGYHAHYDKEFIDAIQDALRVKNEA
jgi:hypothetical protein